MSKAAHSKAPRHKENHPATSGLDASSERQVPPLRGSIRCSFAPPANTAAGVVLQELLTKCIVMRLQFAQLLHARLPKRQFSQPQRVFQIEFSCAQKLPRVSRNLARPASSKLN
jgi:hypothetical protein